VGLVAIPPLKKHPHSPPQIQPGLHPTDAECICSRATQPYRCSKNCLYVLLLFVLSFAVTLRQPDSK
jgi:hypothetical protein